eukprot:GHVU01059891.1.p1 GENE.GHVU01059891.1~~GHVU01059891.1.p1  ORF type:complete len:310 (-),score=66.17 GHVU01059891.1:236-1039(-)
MDAVASNGEILNYVICEHVENAGVHSGDATLILPPQRIYVETIRRMRKITEMIANALRISGPFNIQFVSKRNEVKVIECNLRASRTFPFISKTFNIDFISLATRVMIGAPHKAQTFNLLDMDYVGVKVPMFSFMRLRGADPTLGVEMRSTGEVAAFGTDMHEALLKAALCAGFEIPKKGILFSAGREATKIEMEPSLQQLAEMGYKLFATAKTHQFLTERGFEAGRISLASKPLAAPLPCSLLPAAAAGRAFSCSNSKEDLESTESV